MGLSSFILDSWRLGQHLKSSDVSRSTNDSTFLGQAVEQYDKTDDTIAIVLGHEMSHALLRHGAEKLSRAPVIDFISFVGLSVVRTVQE